MTKQPIKTGVAPEQPKDTHKSTCAFLKHPYADCTCEQPGVPILAADVNGKLLGEEKIRELNEFIKTSRTEQPNQNLMIVKTIEGLIGVVNHNLGKLNENTKMLSCHRNSLILQALEEIDIFQKTTMHDLRKAFE